MLMIPLQPVPSQSIAVQLADQACQILVYQKSTDPGLFLDLYVADAAVVLGVICENHNRLVRGAYLGFIGDLMFVDNQGTSDPDYTGLGALGARFNLIYVEETDLTAAGL